MVRLGTSEGGKGIKAEHPGGEKAPGQAVARAQPTVQPGGGQRRQRARGSGRSIRCRGWAGPSARQRTGGIGQKCTLVGASDPPPTAGGLKSQSLHMKALRLTHMGNKFEASRSGGRVEPAHPTLPPLRNRSKTVDFYHAQLLSIQLRSRTQDAGAQRARGVAQIWHTDLATSSFEGLEIFSVTPCTI